MKSKRKMNKWLKITLWVVGVLVVAAAGVYVAGTLQQRSLQAARLAELQNVTTVKTGPLSASISATGSVRSNQEAVIAWSTSGTVDQVNAALGDQVKSGQTLAVLKDSSLSASVIQARSDLIQAQLDLADLKVSTVNQANAQLALVNAQKAYDEALRQRQNLDYGATAATKDLAYADYVLAQQKLDQMQKIFDNFAGRDPSDPQRALAVSNLAAAQQARDRALVVYNTYTGKPTQATVDQYDANLAVAKANLDEAQRTYDQIKNGPSQSDLAMAQAKVAAAEASAAVNHLEAPFNGTITAVDVMPGDTVSNGTQAFQLDDFSKLLVDASVSLP